MPGGGSKFAAFDAGGEDSDGLDDEGAPDDAGDDSDAGADGKSMTVRVKDILYQPESAGELHR